VTQSNWICAAVAAGSCSAKLPCHEDQVDPFGGQPRGELFTDATAGAGDECGVSV
jgi:hypothetical protein